MVHSTHPASMAEGRMANRHQTWGRDAMDASALSDVQRASGRLRRVGLAPSWQVLNLRF
jgi:hypothetical protein